MGEAEEGKKEREEREREGGEGEGEGGEGEGEGERGEGEGERKRRSVFWYDGYCSSRSVASRRETPYFTSRSITAGSPVKGMHIIFSHLQT